MRCPNCNRLMTHTHLMYIEECLGCGTCYDVFHGKVTEREWVYGAGYPDDDEDDIDDEEYERLEAEAFGGHKDVWIDMGNGQQQRVLGDPNMPEETKKALAHMIEKAVEAIQREDFDDDD